MIIDTHTHLLDVGHWPDEWWDWVAADWARAKPGRTPSSVRGRIEQGLIDPTGARMISRMDGAGVDKSVLLPIDWGPDFTGTRPIGAVVDKMLDLADRSGGRLIPFGGIDPRRDGAVEMVTEWFERGIRGLKLYPSCGWDPTSDAAMEIYQVCEVRKAPVLFHTGHPLPLLDAERSNPMHLQNAVLAFPDLPVWLGHAGAPVWWSEALKVAQSGPNVRLEMSVWLWDDSDADAELEFTRKILEAGESIGFDRLLFGTDHVSGSKVRQPDFLDTIVAMYRRIPEHAERLGRTISAEQLSMIMGGVAAHDLGIAI
ncbi:amidohydrolase family protein [Streptomyces sp. BH106]|uniref:amidohydrolase family protein n=1 Tax=Streptomyces sp. BH106 TaxID=3410409 RepID=UPI003CECAA2B